MKKWKNYFFEDVVPPTPGEVVNEGKTRVAGDQWDDEFFRRLRDTVRNTLDLEKGGFSEHLQSWLKVWKEEGFELAARDSGSRDVDLQHRLEEIRQQSIREIADIELQVVQFCMPHQERIDLYAGILRQIEDRLALQHRLFEEWLGERKRWEGRKEAAYAEKRDIEEQIAAEKSDMLAKWIEEATKRITEILKASEEVLIRKQEIARNIFEQNREQNVAIVGKLTILNDQLEQELKDNKEREKIIAGEGYHGKTTRFLLKTGYAVIVGAGLFFSIFTYHAAFSSNDIASFIGEGLLHRAAKMIHSDYSRIFQLLGVLGIIAFASLVCRAAIIHIRKRQARELGEKEMDSHELQLMIRNDTVRYSGRIMSGNSSLLWFKILPFMLLMGTIMIFIAYEPTKGLFNSMGGLAMGSLIAAGIAAFLYLYTVKIIEPRLLKAKGKARTEWAHLKWLLHWELTVVILLFILSTFFIAGYTQALFPAQEDLSHGVNRLISLLWFLSLSLMNGFIIAYGIRYQSLKESQSELVSKILNYNALIDMYKGVVRTDINQRLNQDADFLFRKLMEQLIRRDNVINKNGVATCVTRRQSIVYRKDGQNRWKNTLADVQRWWTACLRWIEKALLPSEAGQDAPSFSHMEEQVEHMIIPWEEEFYASLSHRKKIPEEEIERCDNEIEQLNKKIAASADIQSEPYASLLRSHEQVMERQQASIRKRLDAIGAGQEGAGAARAKYQLAVNMIRQGYEMGVWYKKIDPDM